MRPPKPPSVARSTVRVGGRARNLERRFTDSETGAFGGAAVRIAFGQLYNDADVIDPGSGDWTAEWNDEDSSSPSTNIYTIRFDPVFAVAPAVVLTPNNNNAAGVGSPLPYFVEQKAVSTDWVTVITYKLDGGADDGGFNFVAVALTIAPE